MVPPTRTAMQPNIEFDDDAFAPMRICGVTHNLGDHPLLQLGSIVALADRLSTQNAIRYHAGNADAGTSFEKAPALHRIDGSPEEAIRRIESANAWLSLHNVHLDPVYGKLVKEVLDSVKPRVERKDSGMFSYAGWIFVASPGAVTPYHMDFEHNFILQIRGEKEIHVFDPLERSVVSEECLERFHSRFSRELVTYEDRHEAHASVFHAKPGVGAYMPSTAPHWVKNGDNVSITISFTYRSDETERRATIHRVNAKQRALGLRPADIGAHPWADAAKFTVAQSVQALKRAGNALRPPREVFASAVQNSNAT